MITAAQSSLDKAPSSPVKLGEELPIFCERCGYSLHGLAPVRCQHCEILQFQCPECGHHQPINTLRPAAQRILGRLRAMGLIAIVFFKLNFFGWLLFAWVAMGVEWSYAYQFRGGGNVQFTARPFDFEAAAAFSLFALAFGAMGRMLLLRWKRGYLVGIVLSGLVALAVVAGAWIRTFDLGSRSVSSPWTMDLGLLLALTACMLVLAAEFVWPIWAALVRAFLPRNAARLLLDWQRSTADRTASELVRH